MFQSDPSKANNKAYFTQVYKELADLQVMRGAFQFFKNFDLGDWNYRLLPKSDIKNSLVSCSEKTVTKFHRQFMSNYSGCNEYQISGEDIYESYKGYCFEYGMGKVSNRHHVVANLMLHCPFMRRSEDMFFFTEAQRAAFLVELG
jgi:hypothetical protein